jgi:hypothetical protein
MGKAYVSLHTPTDSTLNLEADLESRGQVTNRGQPDTTAILLETSTAHNAQGTNTVNILQSNKSNPV